MKSALKNKWTIVAGLVLAAGLLFAATLHVYGMNEEYKTVSESVHSMNRVKREAMRISHIHQIIDETAATMVEPVVEVAAAPAEEVLEEAAEEASYEEAYYEEAYYEGDPAAAYEEFYSADDLRFMGVIYAGGWRWTWYSQNVLPGGGLAIPGRYVDENGYVCDENGRICLASSDLEWGTVVSTPFGKEGCVYDSGCDFGTLDVYVDF